MFNTSHDHGKIWIEYYKPIVYDGPYKFIMVILTLHIMMLLMILCDPIPSFHRPCETIQKKMNLRNNYSIS